MGRRLKRMRLTLWIGAGAALLLSAVALYLPMDTAPYLDGSPSGEMFDRSGRLLYAFLDPSEQWRFVRDLDAVNPHLLHATLAAEDERFYLHPGVDPFAVVRAAIQNVRHARVVSGASTLTMQVVKLAAPAPRSLWGKAAQACRALRLERHATKDQILCAYLNAAPYGLNLVGCEAASRRYFGKPAAELALSEAALLAGLPKAPTAFMPLAHPERARTRRDYVLERMRDEGYITAEVCRRACAEPLGARWHAFPSVAPHMAMQLRAAIEHEGAVRVTLDFAVQQTAEDLLKRWIKRFDGDITNAAAIVIDVQEASVLARVGSVDFFTTPGGGQFDAARAVRSPGSTLKPFTYALAMERDLLYPSEALLDDSIDFGLYSPGNFDGRFNGLITATDALRYSLNVPAIAVLDRVGVASVHALLESAGLTTLDAAPSAYGLGLTLGNCEVRLDELAAAYCAVANLGEYRPLRIRCDETPAAPRRVLSRGVCLSLYNMLEQPFPEEFGSGLARATGVVPRVCWKTGTSTGYHDAWAFAFNRQYVVGVWLGNNSGRPSARLVGAASALPLAGRLFRALEPKAGPAWPDAEGDLRPVTVCAVSGLPASPWCPATKTVWLPRDQYVLRKCDVHYPRSNGSEGTLERWPGSAKGWDLAKIESPKTVPTAATSQSDAPQRVEGLRVLAPADKAEYILTGEPTGDRLRLHASTDLRETLSWYLNGRYLGASTPGAPLFLDLAPGEHKLACMGTDGMIDTVHFEVDQPSSPMRFKSM